MEGRYLYIINQEEKTNSPDRITTFIINYYDSLQIDDYHEREREREGLVWELMHAAGSKHDTRFWMHDLVIVKNDE